VVRRIGHGGMGVVYEAVNERLGRTEALKMLKEMDESQLKRFLREGRLAARIGKHPHLVSVYSAGEHDGQVWLAMEYVDGGDVQEMLAASGGRLELDDAIVVADRVASALDHLHANGIVHRDVKAANILVPRNEGPEGALLTDYGIAHFLGGGEDVTREGELTGSLQYMAPEVWERGPDHPASDQYALACLFVELLTGGRAFEVGEGEPVSRYFHAHAQGPRPKPSEKYRLLPKAIDGVFARALAVDPEQRYPTCREFVDDVQKAILGDPMMPREESVDSWMVPSRNSKAPHPYCHLRPQGDCRPTPTAVSFEAEPVSDGSLGATEKTRKSRKLVPRDGRKNRMRLVIIAGGILAAIIATAWIVLPWRGIHSDITSSYQGFLPAVKHLPLAEGPCREHGEAVLCDADGFQMSVTRYGSEEERDRAVARFDGSPVELDVVESSQCVRNHPIDIIAVEGGHVLAPRTEALEADLLAVGLLGDEFWSWFDRVTIIGC